MKTILAKKISLSFVLAILIIGYSTPVVFSDSFVDDGVLDALKDFKFGRSVSEQSVQESENQPPFEGDSLVDAAVLESLKDFRFGVYDNSEKVMTPVKALPPLIQGDSFVDANVLKQLDRFVFLKGIDPKQKQVAGHGGFVDKN